MIVNLWLSDISHSILELLVPLEMNVYFLLKSGQSIPFAFRVFFLSPTPIHSFLPATGWDGEGEGKKVEDVHQELSNYSAGPIQAHI